MQLHDLFNVCLYCLCVRVGVCPSLRICRFVRIQGWMNHDGAFGNLPSSIGRALHIQQGFINAVFSIELTDIDFVGITYIQASGTCSKLVQEGRR